MTKFLEEGDVCQEEGCSGTMQFPEVENCSCHISAPCNAHVNNSLTCDCCGYEVINEPVNDYVTQRSSSSEVYSAWKPRELDPTKIDFRSAGHTHFSMIKEGVYPEGCSMQDVLAVVKGTFGGRFESFGNGKFKYIAYTD